MDKYLSRQQMQVIFDQAPKGTDRARIIDAAVDSGYTIEGFNDNPTVQPKTKTTIGQRVSTDISNRANNINDMVSGDGEFANQSPLRRAVSATAEAFGAIPQTMLNVAPEPIRKGVEKVGELVGEGVDVAQNVLSKTPIIKRLAENEPGMLEEGLAIASGAGSIAGSILTADLAATAVNKVAQATPKTLKAVSDTATKLLTKSDKQIESNIINNFSKGIKPTNQKTIGKDIAYKDSVVDAVKSIKENQQNLSFVDDTGETIIGQTPKSIKQLADSLEQTKKGIFNQYDTLSKQAGEAGLKIDVSPIAKELDSVIANKALAVTNPKAVEYAKATKLRLSKIGKLDAQTGQEIVQNYNKSLEAFYRNPSYDTASQAAIDALLANKFRQALDDGISGLTGKQYGVLKKQYGALKTIEKDVVRAALREARSNTKGLIDFPDILSGGQVVSGIASLNPALIAQGITQKGIASFYKYLNSPSRAIEKMFSDSQRLIRSKNPGNNLLQTQASTINPSNPNINVIPK